MKATIRATVKVAGIQKERRFVVTTPARVIDAWRRRTARWIRQRYPATTAKRSRATGTIAADIDRYLPMVRHLAAWANRRAEIRHWLRFIGHKYRHTVSREDVFLARSAWVEQGIAPKTINNRVSALRNMYKLLDPELPTPCDGIGQLPSQRVPAVVVSSAVVNAVAETLRLSPRKHAAADRARLMVLASTGKRPCEVERAMPQDVDLFRRRWAVRDAKGGHSEGMYLNGEMVYAWEEFIAANAWGTFEGHFSRRLRDAGWPERVRPYNLRHSTWITASERGIDLADIQAAAGHKRMATTRIHYVPVLNSRMQRLSETLEGRFGWVKPKTESA